MSSLKSASFSLSNQLLRVVLLLAGLSILGRILDPSDFGTFGIVYAFYALLLPILDFGLTPVFLKQDTESEKMCNALFTIYMVIGVCAAIVIISAIPLAASVYEDPIITQLLLGLSLVALLQCYILQPSALLMHRKQFGYLLISELTGSLLGLVAAISAAVSGFGPWSLLLQQIVSLSVRAFLVNLFTNRRYRFLNLRVLGEYREIMMHGLRILSARLLGGLAFSLDRLILGKIYSTTLVGYYSNAMQIALMPDNTIRTALTTPALSHIAAFEGEQKAHAYLMLNNIIIPLAGIPCLIFVVIGDWIMPWFLGEKWVEAGIYLQILGVLGIGRIIHGMTSIVNMNELNTRSWLIVNLASTTTMLAPLLAYLVFDIDSVLFVLIFAAAYTIFWLASYSRTLVNLDAQLPILGHVARSLLVTVAGGLFSGLAVRAYYSSGGIPPGFVQILLASIAVAIGVMVLQVILNRAQTVSVATFIKNGLRTHQYRNFGGTH